MRILFFAPKLRPFFHILACIIRAYSNETERSMVEEIYGDVLFVINFSMDFLSLYMVGKLLHIDMRAFCVILGATLGASYGVLELLLSVGHFVSLLLTVGVMLLMCLVSFGKQTGRRFLMSVVLYCGVNMLIGGMMTAAFVHLGAYKQYIEIGGALHTVWGDMPMWLFVILASLSAVATWGLGRIFRAKRAVRTCELRLSFDGKEKEMTALVDSGNLLSEPLSGTPVIFLKEKDAVFLPPSLLDAMRKGICMTAVETGTKLRFVPSKTAMGEGILLAAVPESVVIRTGGTYEKRKALVAVDFTDGDFGGFPALVPEILI